MNQLKSFVGMTSKLYRLKMTAARSPFAVMEAPAAISLHSSEVQKNLEALPSSVACYLFGKKCEIAQILLLKQFHALIFSNVSVIEDRAHVEK